MFSVRCGLLLLGLDLTTLSVAVAARAAEPVEPIRVELTASRGCGSDQELLQAVLARTSRARAATASEVARVVQVAISRDAQGKLVGELSISDPAGPGGASEKRTISSDSCPELFDALALFAALAVDPQASTEPPKPKPAAQAAPPEPARPPAPLPPAPPRRELGAAVGIEGGTLAADTRSLLSVFEPYFALSFRAARASGFSFAPLARLSFLTVGGDTHDTSDGPARVHWTTLRLGGCPVALGIVRTVTARPCIDLSAGALSASGTTIAHPESHTLSWIALGPSARLDWHPHPLIELSASLGADLPLKRDHFYFEPDTFAYRPPWLLGRALLGAGLHFL